MGCESSDVVRFDLRPLLQGQTRIAKSAYTALIIGPRGPTYRKSWAGNLLMWSDLTLGPLLQDQATMHIFCVYVCSFHISVHTVYISVDTVSVFQIAGVCVAVMGHMILSL